ncbi:N-6 DNA methylase [Candidatus Poribacteria bacterium]|nr:N-6 DNA methylase [Candidatus Poribacteria bacterium]
MREIHFKNYLNAIKQNLSIDNATEHTHRLALKNLVEALVPDLTATNEPKRIACGAPDFIVTRGQVPIGYIEAKNIGVSLDAAEKSEQMKRYCESLNNLILTDYLEFRWYVEGEKRATAYLADIAADVKIPLPPLEKGESKIKMRADGVEAVSELLQQFFDQQVPTVGSPQELAERMARLTRFIRDTLVNIFRQEEKGGNLHVQLNTFRELLVPDLKPEQFADMYAQTIAYGLFAARANAPLSEDSPRMHAAMKLVETNAFLGHLFYQIAGPDLDMSVAYAADDLARLLTRVDMDAILQNFGKRTRQEDPVRHFYETFLAAYDPKLRETRGVYYTPEPVVSYIVRSLDYLLKTYFNRPMGLADTDTLILDPAVGTATFLYSVMNSIHDTIVEKGQAGAWKSYVSQHLIPRLFGFELLMAPYAVAHLKLSILLKELGYKLSQDERLNIFMTNALEKPIQREETLGFAGFISEEGNQASDIKKNKPIMVVLGNPPYSVSSANKGEHIEELMALYKEGVREERNIQPLSDDYIKFIRFAHERIKNTGYGIIGMITNHSYLSGLIHRGMRKALMDDFSEIYVLDLHGNSLMKEQSPPLHSPPHAGGLGGGKDENVFDIQQGVAISLFVRHVGACLCASPQAKVYHADLWGLRENKYRWLSENDVRTTEWQELKPEVTPNYFFVPKDFDLQAEYDEGWSVSEIFPVNSMGITTSRDHFVFDFSEISLRERISVFQKSELSDDDVKSRFGLKDSGTWKVSDGRTKLRKDLDWEKSFTLCYYRPFDIRPIFYNTHVIERSRPEVMQHMLFPNKALLTMRGIRTDTYAHFLVANVIVDKSSVSIKDNCYVFPLYLYDTPTAGELDLHASKSRRPNLNPKFLHALEERLGSRPSPEEIFNYAYAVFHSPTYRQRYAEFLKIDFPRLPLTSDRGLFDALAEKGAELVSLHLMVSPALNNLITRFPVDGSNEVDKVEYVEMLQVVHINKTQYFEGVSRDLWEFHIGGYRVLEKWLKDRKGRTLSYDDILHYQRIVVALKETMRLMQEIDELIPMWPIV